MKITKKAEGKSLLLALEGELNTNTAPELEAALNPEIDAAENVIIDMKKLNYVTSFRPHRTSAVSGCCCC